MLKSMTGYGTAQFESEECVINTEVKALNSKFIDIMVKLPREYSEKELELRKLVSDKLERGKISVSLEVLLKSNATPRVQYNSKLFDAYYSQLLALARKVEAPTSELFKIALHSPEVMTPQEGIVDSGGVWPLIKENLVSALAQCDGFREREGRTLKKKIDGYLKSISNELNKIEELEPERANKIKTRIDKNLSELIDKEQYDKNRFEQELIYYLEKLDIAEEMVRLKSHIKYFLETANQDSVGKKLGFISQEMGREINTIGSKANDAKIQKMVVVMKEELEKIKEQLLNIL